MYKNAIVKLNFSEGSGSDYDFPYVQNISDPIAGMKANVIQGTRASGAIVIPAGKKSIEINVKGIIWSNDGYADLVSKMDEMRAEVTTNPATLTLKHWDDTISGGGGYVTDWSFSVIRIEEITFGSSMRTEQIEYDAKFFVIAY